MTVQMDSFVTSQPMVLMATLVCRESKASVEMIEFWREGNDLCDSATDCSLLSTEQNNTAAGQFATSRAYE